MFREEAGAEQTVIAGRPAELPLIDIAYGRRALTGRPNANGSVPCPPLPAIRIKPRRGYSAEVCGRLALALLIACPQRNLAVLARRSNEFRLPGIRKEAT